MVSDIPQGEPTGGRRAISATVALRVAGVAGSAMVRVRNLSAGGLMAELPDPLSPGSAVEIDVPGVGWVAGHIVWQTEGRAGVAFDSAIDTDAVALSGPSLRD
ncbi:MAG: PilZ domain-containing protein [Sphingomonas sp.]|uniref:PilZ domain-containing protein n=1 Tax=Sphingomonas adhaesiva TaxID=28212 RepID=A0A2A4IBC6_9SPHN|nr:PilZ domain-containing protein [Sphingomonas adhaesiva]PZU80764.1 MAG: PilZ domain-containing protein [Sphingomonas sp.]